MFSGVLGARRKNQRKAKVRRTERRVVGIWFFDLGFMMGTLEDTLQVAEGRRRAAQPHRQGRQVKGILVKVTDIQALHRQV